MLVYKTKTWCIEIDVAKIIGAVTALLFVLGA